ncbi:hypothetical protein EDC94DRAFT_644595 [Helicostylum pulchrum]|nr:hypothetical protein EDC94DRAFT_644595 [Helicostylum pulchrum]
MSSNTAAVAAVAKKNSPTSSINDTKDKEKVAEDLEDRTFDELHENFIFLDTDSTTDNETTALLDDLTRLSNKPVTVVCGSLIRKLVNCPPSLAGEKRKLGGNIVPFSKDRLLHIMKSIATSDDPSNIECYNYEFITAETQYQLMEEFFSNLQQYCTIDRLQYWVGQSNIWGPCKRKTTNGQTKYGRHLWIVRKEMREFLVESTDSISAYWDHLKNEVDKLYYRMRCEDVYVSTCCFAGEPILERDSPVSDHLLSVIKGCNGGITDLTKRIHYTQKHIRPAIIDYAGLSTSPNDIRKFLDTYPQYQRNCH